LEQTRRCDWFEHMLRRGVDRIDKHELQWTPHGHREEEDRGTAGKRDLEIDMEAAAKVKVKQSTCIAPCMAYKPL